MSDLPVDFAEFFGSVNDGRRPFAWQQRLVDHLLDSGRWPDAITAPTGTGKSSVVDAHVFACAAATWSGVRLPRRMAVVVNRRALVDQHHVRALEVNRLLAEAEASPESASRALVAVAEALRSLVATETARDDGPIEVVSLRGGVPPERSWIDDPVRCAIVCATPDMWGSRLLFRGYGSSRFSRPREAGLLAVDSVMVLDEAHLNRQLLHTARTVSRLVSRDSTATCGPALQVVETSATPAGLVCPDQVTIGVESSDIDGDTVLARRITAPKSVVMRTVGNVPKPVRGRSGRPTAKYVAELASLTESLSRRVGVPAGGRTVGCFVNRVQVATGVTAALRSAGVPVELRIGPMRPWDLRRQLEEKPGLYSIDGDPATHVIVATQTIEVGVDIDLGGAVTELASAPALAQRAGRVNRLGRSSDAVVEVVVPGGAKEIASDGPYSAEELRESLSWLLRRQSDAAGMAPGAILTDPPPPADLSRVALSTVTTSTAEMFAETATDLFHEPSLDLYLRDDLGVEEPGIGLVIRGGLPIEDDDALSLLVEVPPQDIEVFPTTFGVLVPLLEKLLGEGSDDPLSRAFVYRDGEMLQMTAGEVPAAGDVVVVDDVHRLFVEGVVVDEAGERANPVPWGDLEGIAEVHVDPEARGSGDSASGDAYRNLCEKYTADEAMLDQAAVSRPFVPGPIGAMGLPTWIVVRSETVPALDDEIMQIQSTRDHVVLLETHQRDVATKAVEIAWALGLGDDLREDLRVAGLHHDDGKTVAGFQALLGGSADRVLAKSRSRSERSRRRARAESSLPWGWRHEQRSVVDALAAGVRSELALRLIGTSHGRGRPWFPHALDFCDEEPLSKISDDLFLRGDWANLIETTQRVHGAWGCAYLEALFRAADCQVSRKGC